MNWPVLGLVVVVCCFTVQSSNAQPTDKDCRSELKSALDQLKRNSEMVETLGNPDFFTSFAYVSALRALDEPKYKLSRHYYEILQTDLNNHSMAEALHDTSCEEYARKTLTSLPHK